MAGAAAPAGARLGPAPRQQGKDDVGLGRYHHPSRPGRRRGPRQRPRRHDRRPRRRPAAHVRQAAADHRRRRLPRLLPGPGAGRLERRPPRRTPHPGHRLRQLLSGRARVAGGAGGTPRRRAGGARHAGAAAGGDGRLRLRHPRRRDRLAHLLSGAPHRDDGRQHQRAADPARPRPPAPGGRRGPGGLPLLLLQRDLRRPGPRSDPHPRDLPGQRLLHRPARLLRRVQALRRDALRQFRPPARRPRHHGAAVQQLRPGNEDHRRPRDPRLFRDALAGRDMVLLSDGSPTRTFCYVADAVAGYYLALLRGRPGEAYNIGVDGPEIADARSGGDDRRARHELFGLHGRGGPRPQHRGRLPGGQPRAALPGHHQGQDRARLPAQLALEDGLRRTLLWYRGNRGGEER